MSCGRSSITVAHKQPRPHLVLRCQALLRMDVKSTCAFIPSSCICDGIFFTWICLLGKSAWLCAFSGISFLSLALPVSFSLSLCLFLSLSLSFSLVFLGTLLRHSQTQVHIVRWWMKHYGSRTSKRHMGFANSPAIRRLDLGRLQVSKGPAPKTCVKYHDRQGRLKYKGTKHLKATEILC